MKKILPVLIAALALVLLLAACGGNNETADIHVSATMAPTDTPAPTAEPTPEPTDTPEPTAEPEQTEEPATTEAPENTDAPAEEAPAPAETTAAAASDPTAAPESTPEPTPEPTAAPDNRSIALGMIGQDINALYAAVGSPNSTDYAASCMIVGGDDGILYYDDFTVYTYRYADGTEFINFVE